MTLVPNFRITGILAILASLVVMAWSALSFNERTAA